MGEERKTTTLILIVITFLLLAIALVIVARITQNQAPSDTNAAVIGSALTECILAKRPDILPFYQKNGWDINNHDAIIANWKTIDPAGYNTVAAQCGSTSASTTPEPAPAPTPAPTSGSESTSTSATTQSTGSQSQQVAGTSVTSLPNTAIFDDRTDAILLGIFSIVIGLVLWKSSMFDSLVLMARGEVTFNSRKRSYTKYVESIIESIIQAP